MYLCMLSILYFAQVQQILMKSKIKKNVMFDFVFLFVVQLVEDGTYIHREAEKRTSFLLWINLFIRNII